ncbi:hypothetical protein [Gracilibacillus salinarum]|uniref:Uncharacterized protein n=1 Tax=Gracilibacillus salinarum TaxID=2932255 RepID=A0ABY4GR46_9BACI|nr:hypothetical protein [Gracilibacillus salinarum]UOQ86832.1 hypothetical protein MUN87_08075 [Gracilibacillus salinarum]
MKKKQVQAKAVPRGAHTHEEEISSVNSIYSSFYQLENVVFTLYLAEVMRIMAIICLKSSNDMSMEICCDGSLIRRHDLNKSNRV